MRHPCEKKGAFVLEIDAVKIDALGGAARSGAVFEVLLTTCAGGVNFGPAACTKADPYFLRSLDHVGTYRNTM